MNEYIKKADVIAFLREKYCEECDCHESPIAPDVCINCRTLNDIVDIKDMPAADVRPVVQREAVMQALNKYFSIGDSDTYELTRVKEAFYVGTMTLDDFAEWNEDNVSDLCDYLMKEIFCPNCGADMREENKTPEG